MKSIRHRLEGSAIRRPSLAAELGLGEVSKLAKSLQTNFQTKLAAELWLNIGGKDFRLVGKTIRIGRAEDNDIVLDHKSVSRYHAMLSIHQDKVILEDMKSRNGIRANGIQVRRAELKDNDEVSIGDLEGVFFQRLKKQSSRAHEPASPNRDFLGEMAERFPVASYVESFKAMEPKRKKMIVGSVILALFALWFVASKPATEVLRNDKVVESATTVAEIRPSDRKSFERCVEAEDLGNFRQASVCYKNLAQTAEVQTALERLKKRQSELSERRYKEGKQAFENYYYDMAILKFQEVMLVSDDESEYRHQALRGIKDAEEKKRQQ